MQEKNVGPVDAIIAAVSGYEPEHMAVWFNSLKATSFRGRIFIVAYDVSEKLVAYMQGQGATVFTFDHDASARCYRYNQLREEIHDHDDNGKLRVDRRWTWMRKILRFKDKIYDRRFYHASLLLARHLEQTGEELRFLAFSDTRDLVFQANPFEWLEQNLEDGQMIAVGEEGVTHMESWNRRNVIKTYGFHALERVRDLPVCCAGFFAGRAAEMLDFMLAVYYFDQTKRSGDQAAFNQLLTFAGWKEKSLKVKWTTPWVVHATTLLSHRTDEGFFAAADELPVFEDGTVKTAQGEPYAVVHQYDRSPEWRAFFDEKYGQL